MAAVVRAGYVTRGALSGVAIGIALAFLLLWIGNWGRGEAMEGAAILAYLVAQPLAFLTVVLLDWGQYANQWVAFVALVVPVNWALLGAATGAVVRAWRNRRRLV